MTRQENNKSPLERENRNSFKNAKSRIKPYAHQNSDLNVRDKMTPEFENKDEIYND